MKFDFSRLAGALLIASAFVTVGCTGQVAPEATASADSVRAQGDDAVIAAIKKITDDATFLYTSESDYPFTVSASKGFLAGELTKAEIKDLVKDNAEVNKVENTSFGDSRSFSVSDWFDRQAAGLDTTDADSNAYAAKLSSLRAAIEENLTDTKVVRFGHRQAGGGDVAGPVVTIVIAGKLPSGRAATIVTFSVET